MNLRDEYLRNYGGYEDLAAIALARDLMEGDPQALRAGYTVENAVIAANDVFPNAMIGVEDVERMLVKHVGHL